MTKETYRIRLGTLSHIMYRRCKGKRGDQYAPYNHVWWLLTIESQRATDLKTTRD